ncbi:ABC transporter ATP-binding protein/permease [Acidovorax sp. NCPPB 3859]|nr:MULTISPECIES: ABC transporter ATP-binding protein [unclassified Acidovorax]MDA8448681.1 ABC transporter ATP-binding protein/permease [Acidovorax sp. GBBC 3297]MDA8458200.1 ABC transporter ATP-binding protein/permease [Acidovorax sp. GBBC 3333]MDA8463238.1 ABC transporter ATP-binding protein/permease [Acidovorax sp. GBBC 3332]WCM79765.1 ABC transporter ATP-binding protein/permease [Acidovorax sp. GBBC 712]WCM84664.1 ABC transporter ATP-binding protein/permease [Acidovorax sp. NCPPB 3859]
MTGPWSALARLLAWAPARRRLVLFLLMLMAGATEGIGVLLLVPLLGVLQGEAVEASGAVARGVVHAAASLGLPSGAPLPLLALFCGLVLLRNAVQYARECAAARLQQQVADRLREASFSALLGAQWRWVVAQRTAEQANLLLSDVARIGIGLGHGMGMLASLATAAVYLLAAFTLHWKLALACALGGALLLALLAGHRRGVMALGRQLTVASQRLHASLHDSLAGLRLAKILGAEVRYRAWIAGDAGRLRDQQLRFATGLSLSKALLHSAGALLLAAYVYLGLRVWAVPVAELLTLVLVFARLLPLLAMGHQQQQMWLHAAPAFAGVEHQLAEARAWAEPEMGAQEAAPTARTAIALCGVGVRYEGRAVRALDDVSLAFPVRTTTAVVGASGAGKSTLADVLCGLLGPDEGALEIDGVPLDARARRAWRRAVAYVSQDTFLFNDSVRGNLLLAAPDADDEALRRALEQACAQFVHALPQGWDTVVGERGVQLSGGERQRIALARALLQRPALLILDEATSALDHDNEARVREAIERLHGDLTVVVIGHRLALLERADRVVLLERGRIRMQGRWDDVAPYWMGAR